MTAKLNQAIVLDNFGGGTDNRNRINKLAAGSLRLIENADVTNSGTIKYPRPGYAQIAGSGGHSAWTWPPFHYALYVDTTGNLIGINKNNQSLSTLTTGLSPGQSLTYAYFAGRAYYSNGSDQGYIDGNSIARFWGVDPPPQPTLTASSGGVALDAGRYIVALTVTYNVGEESAASPASLITLSSAGTITVPTPTHPDITHVNIYVSSVNAPNGSQLYYHGRVVNGTSSYVVEKSDLLRPLKTQNMARFPACTFIASWKRHLLGIVGHEVVWSRPEQAGAIWDAQAARINFSETPTFIAPVDDGVYVGTRSETYFLSGTDPMQPWQKVRIEQHGIIPQKSVCWLPGDTFQGEIPTLGPAVPWITTEGEIVVGRNGGFIQKVAPRLAVNNHASSRIQFFEYNGIRRLLVTLQQAISINPRISPDITPGNINTHNIVIT